MTTTLRSAPRSATASAACLLLLPLLAATGCGRPPEQRPPQRRLAGELAPQAESMLARLRSPRLTCTRWMPAGELGDVRGCYAVGPDAAHYFFYVDTSNRVLSVGMNRSVPRDSVYATVEHSAMVLSHQYGLPGECREGALRAYFWHAPTHHATVLSYPDLDTPRSPVDVVLIAGPLSCGESVIYRSPVPASAAVASAAATAS